MPNVPPLRFPEFSGEWERTTIGNLAEIVGGGTPETSNQEYWSNDIIWYTPSEIGKKKYISDSQRHISKKGLENSSAKMLPAGTILLSTRATIGECSITLNSCTTNQGFQSLIARDEVNNEYLYYLIISKRKDLIRRACGSTFLEISANEVKKINVSATTIDEQNKLASFLALIDQRIETQIRVIEDLQTLKKAISTKVFTEIKGCNSERLGNLCSITTGKLDANAMTDEGEYMFFTCSKENYKTDTFAFDGEALLIAGNGEIGSVKYYNGKFNAYQRTYVLQNFLANIKYLQFYIEHHLPKRVLKEKNVGAMPYIVLSTLADMPILLPSENKQNNIAKALQVIDNKIYVEYSVLDQYRQQKQFLLQQMFI